MMFGRFNSGTHRSLCGVRHGDRTIRRRNIVTAIGRADYPAIFRSIPAPGGGLADPIFRTQIKRCRSQMKQ